MCAFWKHWVYIGASHKSTCTSCIVCIANAKAILLSDIENFR